MINYSFKKIISAVELIIPEINEVTASVSDLGEEKNNIISKVSSMSSLTEEMISSVNMFKLKES